MRNSYFDFVGLQLEALTVTFFFLSGRVFASLVFLQSDFESASFQSRGFSSSQSGWPNTPLGNHDVDCVSIKSSPFSR